MCNASFSPGKFEAESCITVWAYEMMLNGFQDDTDYGEYGDDVHDFFYGPFTKEETLLSIANMGGEEMCLECLDSIPTINKVTLWVDGNGFVYTEVA